MFQQLENKLLLELLWKIAKGCLMDKDIKVK